jgi:hypothetical protein
MTADVHTANIFDLAWPSIAYHGSRDPDEAHRDHQAGTTAGVDRAGPLRARAAHLRPGTHRAARFPARDPLAGTVSPPLPRSTDRAERPDRST